MLTPKNKRRLLGALAVGGLVLGLRFYQSPGAQSETAEPQAQAAIADAAKAEDPARTAAKEKKETPAAAPAAELPPHPSLRGTDVNGGIRLTADGHVALHRDLRRLFDYYLSLRGRVPAAEIRALLQQHLAASATADQSREALALFDKYVSLIDADGSKAAEWKGQDLAVPAQMASVLEERRRLRREYLGEELATAFFADQESYESYQLERLEIGSNPDLNEAQKAAALAEAEQKLSPEQRKIRHQTFAFLDIKKLLQEPQATLDADTAKAVEERFGPAAVERLAAVAKEKDEWDAKRQSYLAEKARLQARRDLSREEQEKQLLDYGKAHLDANELRRMQALDSEAL